MGNKSEVVSASVPQNMYEYKEENNLSASKLLQEKLSDLMDSKENPLQYVPDKFMKESRKMGLIIMLIGALLLIFTSGLALYFSLIGKIEIFTVMWLVGSIVSYYGYREYSKWNDVLYWRMQKREKGEKE